MFYIETFLQGAVAFKNIYNLGGEIYPAGVNRMYSNFRALRSEGHSLAADLARWDARRLPLREASVDAVVSDMVSLTISCLLHYRTNAKG